MVKPKCRALFPRHDFFKVYLADFSSRHLLHYKVFIFFVHVILCRYYIIYLYNLYVDSSASRLNEKGNVPNKVTLKDHSGKVWDVELEKLHQDLVITKGWQHFVARHSLVDGDFLIFKFDGSSNFDIDLYGRDGLMKMKDADDDDIRIRNVKVENEEFSDTQQDTRPTTNQVKCRGRQLKSVQTTPKALGGGSVRQAKLCGGSESLQFVVNVTKWRCVHVPKRLLRANNIKMKKNLTLHDDDGKNWPVKTTRKKDGKILISTGWCGFLRARGLEIGDKCVFSLLVNDDKECNVIHVKVGRKRGRPARK